MSLFTVVTKNDNFQLPATKLIVGLGNKDPEYDGTRHNFGFAAVDEFVEKHDFAKFASKPKLKSLISENQLEDTKVILVKPQTYMNRSGQAVFALQEYFKITIQDILVVHDDIDLEFGLIRTRLGGGEGGHNGLKSISASIGENYARLRLGVASELRDKIDASDFVLKQFSHKEKTKLADFWPVTNDYIMKFIDEKFEGDSIKLDL